MSLPKVAPARTCVDIDGELFEIRSLTRAEAAHCQKVVQAARPDWAEDVEIYVIAAATDVDVDEARDWYRKTDTAVVEQLLDAIKAVSKLDEGASKSGVAGDSPGG